MIECSEVFALPRSCCLMQYGIFHVIAPRRNMLMQRLSQSARPLTYDRYAIRGRTTLTLTKCAKRKAGVRVAPLLNPAR